MAPPNLENRTGEHLVIGLVSGSSADGIDAALARITGCCEASDIVLEHFSCLTYDAETKQRVLGLFDYASTSLEELCQMHAILGECFADAARLVADEAEIPLGDVSCIGLWGHMTYHLPAHNKPFEWRGRRLGSSLQLGDLNRIAQRTGVTTIGDLANRDIAVGGNGVAMTALGNHVFYHHPERNRVVQNIGGIANADLVPAAGGLSAIVGFDSGPGVMAIDGLVRHYTGGRMQYDEDGHMAARGTVDQGLLELLLDDPFIRRDPPKAADRENFGDHYVRRIVDLAEARSLAPDDVVATATALTAESIVRSHERYFAPICPIDEVIVGGGGAQNPELMRMLAARVDCAITTDDDYGIPSFAREAMNVALIANETRLGHLHHAPQVTGAAEGVLTGLIAPGTGWAGIR